MQLLEYLRLLHDTPQASEISFTPSMVAGAVRVMDAVTKERAEDAALLKLRSDTIAELHQFLTDIAEACDLCLGDNYLDGVKRVLASKDTEIRSLQEKLAACENALADEKCERQMADARIKDLEQEASASDAHASAMEEATMRAMDARECAAEIADIWKGEHLEDITAILLKHFRAAPAVYLTDAEAVAADIVGEATYKKVERMQLLDSIRRFTRPVSRAALAKVIGSVPMYDAAGDPVDDFDRRTADAVLSFLGAGAEEKPLTSQELRDRARASLAAAAREKMDERGDPSTWKFWTGYPDAEERAEVQREMLKPAPAPQESDVESDFKSYVAAQDAAFNAYHLNADDPRTFERMEYEASIAWFRAHRVVELPRRSPGAHPDWAAGFDYAVRVTENELSRAGIAHRSAT